MPRLARTVATGFVHHITQRGNNKQDVFFVDDDCRTYLDFLRYNAEQYSLEVLGYCLMTNHVHIIAIPHEDDSLAKAIGRTHFRYTQYINRFHNRSGHLWQGRFYSCALDERHLLTAMKYIELNPVRAKMCRVPWRYQWSSAAVHIDKKSKSDLLSLTGWYKLISAGQWKSALLEGVDESDVMRLRNNTHTGRPLGSDSFMSKLEKIFGRRIRPLPVGRPKKKEKPKIKKE